MLSQFKAKWWNGFSRYLEIQLSKENSSKESYFHFMEEIKINKEEAKDWLHDSINKSNYPKAAKVIEEYLLKTYSNVN